jgi:hypothetical protein
MYPNAQKYANPKITLNDESSRHADKSVLNFLTHNLGVILHLVNPVQDQNDPGRHL